VTLRTSGAAAVLAAPRGAGVVLILARNRALSVGPFAPLCAWPDRAMRREALSLNNCMLTALTISKSGFENLEA